MEKLSSRPDVKGKERHRAEEKDVDGAEEKRLKPGFDCRCNGHEAKL